MGPREFYDDLPSTQDRAVELARSGAVEGTRVVARRQTAGRGRLARTWHSPEGGLYCSVVLARPAEHAGLLPLTVGARLAAGLRREFAAPTALKWPNDVLVTDRGRRRKLAGILSDAVPSSTLGSAVVVGVGVNVALDLNPLPASLRGTVAALGEFCSPPPSLEDVERVVVDAAVGAATWLAEPSRAGEARAFCERWLEGLGKPVSVDGRPAGTVESLGPDGELWVANAHERMAIWAGDVRVEESA